MCGQYGDNVKSIHFRRNFGKSIALKAGFSAAQGDVIVMMDADLQDQPEEISKLLNELNQKDLDAVSGWKEARKDSFSRRLFSRIFNSVMRKYSGVEIHDFNCGLKAFRKETIQGMVLYGQLHRFILLLVAEKGFKIGEVKVAHQKRPFGYSKYGAKRIYHGFLDFISIVFITRFLHSPLHFFGVMGIVCFLVSLVLAGYFCWLQVYAILWNVPQHNLGNHPMWISTFFFFLAGLIFVCFGLLGALIVHLYYNQFNPSNNKQRPDR
jgi:glycosyltransferase involved in cell wall biosynthesis